MPDVPVYCKLATRKIEDQVNVMFQYLDEGELTVLASRRECLPEDRKGGFEIKKRNPRTIRIPEDKYSRKAEYAYFTLLSADGIIVTLKGFFG